MKDAMNYTEKTALLSTCGTYRYGLTRRWGNGPACGWVMLNPSTADASIDDRTIAKIVRFSARWGFFGITVCNLFALRSTDPSELLVHPDPIGPDNDRMLGVIGKLPRVVVGWGAHPAVGVRGVQALKLIGRDVWCLGCTESGQPRHPLYMRNDSKLLPWPKRPA